MSDTTRGDPHFIKNIVYGLGVAIIVLVADQWIKHLVKTQLPFGRLVEVFPFFSLLHTHNTGIAFSFLDNLSPTILLGLAVVVVAIMMYLWWQARYDGMLTSIGYGMILGGAFGNMIDRGAYGYVIDYVLLHTQTYSFAIFNLADAALTCGVIAIVLATFLEMRRAKS